METHKTCSFFGHREIEITEKLKNNLKTKIEDLIINRDVDIFYFGGFGMFDDLCWQIVSSLRVIYPHIKRIFCLSDKRQLRISKRPKWLNNEDFESFIYLELNFDWWYQRIYYRNIEIINQSDFVIFYVINNQNSGAHKAMKYAEIKKKQLLNMADILDASK